MGHIKIKKKNSIFLEFSPIFFILYVIKHDSLPQIGSKADLKLCSNFTKSKSEGSCISGFNHLKIVIILIVNMFSN